MSETWRKALQESVWALGRAADEFRHALSLAQSAYWGVQLDRIRPVDGQVKVAHSGYVSDDRPHDQAMFRITGLYETLTWDLQEEYERAALVYANGATWAARRVIAGETPAAVAMTSEDGKWHVDYREPITQHLTRWNRHAEYERAEKLLIARENDAALAADLAGQEHLAEHEASEMHDAMQAADGLGDAAFAFGRLAEHALMFTLNVLRPS
ncbi:hypothetical protein [Nonomuraea zeae]|uniref:Uncharacterized protein n=1 Tax=Nonomuraea zeae TaxID=1642303 RepID=A0A5S4H3P4_9ACTN|nr:hypothetical protein [Nonomuraea zeae]TMR39629.1 hypothetical protein ETD85_01045 [Nonomuraea zeae]